MKSLVRKEALAVTPFTAVAVVIATAVWFGVMRFEQVLLAPQEEAWGAVFVVSALAGAVIGYLQFAVERWTGTLRYLLHRGGGHAAVFRAKARVGAFAAYLIGVLPPFAFALWHATGPNAELVQPLRLCEYACVGLSAVSGHAAGVFAAQLGRGWRDVVLGPIVVAGALLFGVLAPAALALRGAPIALAWIGVHVALALALSALARRMFARNLDADLPMPGGLLAGVALVGVPLFLVPAGFAGAAERELFARALIKTYPTLLRDVETGEVFPAVDDDGAWYRAGPDGRAERDRKIARVEDGRLPSPLETRSGAATVEPVELPPARYEIAYQPAANARVERAPVLRLEGDRARRPLARLEWRLLGLEYAHYRGPRTTGSICAHAYLDHEAGYVRLFAMIVPSYFGRDLWFELAEEPPLERTVARTDGKRFSPWTVQHGYAETSLVLADHGDGTLWRFSLAEGLAGAPLAPLGLPDGDRLATFEEEAARSREPLLPIHGRATSYEWSGGRFVSEAEWRDAPTMRRDAELVDDDPRALAVRVRSRAGAEPVVHRFEPSNAAQSLLGAGYLATIVIDPPWKVARRAWSAFGDGHDAPRRAALRPREEAGLLAGAGLVLTVVHALATVLLAAWIWRRTMRAGHGSGVVWTTTLLVAAFGLWACIWLAMFEPRVKRGTPSPASVSETEPAPELLIQSA